MNQKIDKPMEIEKTNLNNSTIKNSRKKQPTTIAELGRKTARNLKKQYKTIYKRKGRFSATVSKNNKNNIKTNKYVTRRKLIHKKFDPDKNETKKKQVSARQSAITSFIS